MYKNKNILILAAHPDDETLGCGATIIKLSKYNEVSLITFTDGVSSRSPAHDSRTNRLNKVCKELGISKCTIGEFPDNQMDQVPLLEVSKFIEESIEKRPDIIFTHHPGCLNIDHSTVYRATLTAFRPQHGHPHEIYSYYIPSSTDYNPLSDFSGNVYHNVADTCEEKIRILKECYSDEMRPFPHSRSCKNIRNLMMVWGAESGLEYAEKFKLIRKVL